MASTSVSASPCVAQRAFRAAAVFCLHRHVCTVNALHAIGASTFTRQPLNPDQGCLRWSLLLKVTVPGGRAAPPECLSPPGSSICVLPRLCSAPLSQRQPTHCHKHSAPLTPVCVSTAPPRGQSTMVSGPSSKTGSDIEQGDAPQRQW